MLIHCDTHVHCYIFEELPKLLDEAQKNFCLQGESDARVLFMTDGLVDRTWKKLLPVAKQGYSVGGWRLTYSSRSGFIRAARDAYEILIAPGRQINSVSKLEYLLLGCDLDIDNALDDREIVSRFAEKYMVISPWGVGKWLGGRGKILSKLIRESEGKLFLGDNGGRPRVWARVPQFSQTTLPLINGSDPLPIPDELNRVASYGITLKLDGTNFIDAELTLSNLLHALRTETIENYGAAMSLFRFIKGRVAMTYR